MNPNDTNKGQSPVFSYGCPRCGWDPTGIEGFYYIRHGKAIDCTKLRIEKAYIDTIDIVDGKICVKLEALGEPKLCCIGKPPFKHLRAYPIISNYRSNPYYSYEFGVDGHDWDETHKCPKCNKTFTFSNGDC